MGEPYKKLLILITVLLLLLFIYRPEGKNAFSLIGMETLGPLLRLADSTSRLISAFWQDYFCNLDAKERLKVLQEELREAHRKRLKCEARLRAEGDHLSAPPEMEHPTLKARIIGYDMVPEPTIAILDKGERHGVKRNMPVIGPDNKVVGKILSTSPNYSKLSYLIDQNCSIGAILLESQEKGILVGSGDGLCMLRYIPLISPVNTGELVITSGTDGIFPEDLPMGRVIDIERPKGSKWCTITVRPLLEFNKIKNVLIILKEDELSRILSEFRE